MKHIKHAPFLPICADLTGPDLHKGDQCFVLSACATWPRIVFRFGASAVGVSLSLCWFYPTSSGWSSCRFRKEKQILMGYAYGFFTRLFSPWPRRETRNLCKSDQWFVLSVCATWPRIVSQIQRWLCTSVTVIILILAYFFQVEVLSTFKEKKTDYDGPCLL